MSHFDEARKYLRFCGIDRPDDDVKLIAAFAAGLPLKTALGAPFPEFTPAAEAKFRRLVSRRGDRREPAAYLVGTEEFMGLELKVTPSVLIPRPSTESLVERAGAVSTFLEIGTGSGAVAIALALRGARGTATDLSARALEIARENAERHGVADRITFMQADLFVEGPFELLISNPPYVATGEMEALPPEVKHEPRLALEAGPDGLDVIRRILAGARAHAPRLLLEMAPHQADAVRNLALQAGFRNVLITKDLDGFDRVLEAS
ncbi:MAG TPA: peptide chain release factor N(5)-glutamine methyltransferase [Planctomycetota bacterium]|nr:peptide chain release factor N(5)-glutamine methyltransferase [Planctomycetota bacterium]